MVELEGTEFMYTVHCDCNFSKFIKCLIITVIPLLERGIKVLWLLLCMYVTLRPPPGRWKQWGAKTFFSNESNK